MTTQTEALKRALEALQDLAYWDNGKPEYHEANKAITAIKEALAQPEQCQCPNCRVTLHASDCAVHNEPAYPKGACNCGAQQYNATSDHQLMENAQGDLERIKLVQTGVGISKPQQEEYLSKAYRLANELRCHLSIAPAPQRTWVGLAKDEMLEILKEIDPETQRLPIGFRMFADAIEAKLKQKNMEKNT